MTRERKALQRFKPGVNRSVHLLAAALLWSVVGGILGAKGLLWINPVENPWFVTCGIALGTIKSFFVLDRVADRVVNRISRMRDGTCLGAVYSWKTWLLVGVMVSSGILLRTFFNPGRYVGTVYLAIGWGLMLSSRVSWRMLADHKEGRKD
ncbi:MAG: hypothetical protein Kow0089_03830 [Desulfobulbaceae bacterium]